MLVDFQTVQPLKAIPLSRVNVVDIGGVLSVRAFGSGFTAIDEVLINDYPSPDVVVESSTSLLAQLPTQLQDVPQVDTVVVLSKTLRTSISNLFKYRIGESPGRLTGLFRLLQLYIKILSTNQGSDSFFPDLGGNLYRSISTNINSRDGQSVQAALVQSMAITTAQVIAMQAGRTDLLPEERLVGVDVEQVTFERATASCFGTFFMHTQAGSGLRANLDF